jgi:hypothetical protein
VDAGRRFDLGARDCLWKAVVPKAGLCQQELLKSLRDGAGQNLAERGRGGHALLASGTKREAGMEGY